MQNLKKGHVPPHSEEAEKRTLAILLEYPGEWEKVSRRPVSIFYDLRHAEIFTAMREMHGKKIPVDVATIIQFLKEGKKLKACGGTEYLMQLANEGLPAANLPYFLGILKEKHALRQLYQVCYSVYNRIGTDAGHNANELSLVVQAELDTVSRIGLEEGKKEVLKMWKPSEILEYQPPDHMRLVGDNEIVMGYEGLCLIAGPGSSGKSLAGMTLALAGAGASAVWMGRPVHRRFKTMIIQAENGAIRMRAEIEAIKKHNPELELDNYILISSPPEGGLPFHKAEFRAAIREQAAAFQPDLVILDTWAQIASEDQAKDVIDKIGEIRSCFPGGERFPGIVIMAHTKKPRADEVRKGRGLINAVSGSIALANAARCVYMLLPWSDEMEDTRIFWACVKLNNGSMYPASVWFRKFGQLFIEDTATNPKDFGKTDDEREKISTEHLREAFGEELEMRTGLLVKKLAKVSRAGESTCWRAIGSDGYLYDHLCRVQGGKVKLKTEGQ